LNKKPPAPQSNGQLQLALHFNVSQGVKMDRLPDGSVHLKPGKMMVEGTVRDACRMLGGISTHRVRILIQTGEIKAWKPMGRRARRDGKPANTKLIVNMLSVEAYRRREKAAQKAEREGTAEPEP